MTSDAARPDVPDERDMYRRKRDFLLGLLHPRIRPALQQASLGQVHQFMDHARTRQQDGHGGSSWRRRREAIDVYLSHDRSLLEALQAWAGHEHDQDAWEDVVQELDRADKHVEAVLEDHG